MGSFSLCFIVPSKTVLWVYVSAESSGIFWFVRLNTLVCDRSCHPSIYCCHHLDPEDQKKICDDLTKKRKACEQLSRRLDELQPALFQLSSIKSPEIIATATLTRDFV